MNQESGIEPKPRPRVVIVDNALRHYRASFLELLRQELDAAGVSLDVVYSEPVGAEGGRSDTVDLPWAHRVTQRVFRLGSHTVTWQRCLHILKGADLVIVEQATRRLLNYVLLVRQSLGRTKVAFWGHGQNFQATSASQRASEAVKRILTRRGQWFFAYNELSRDIVVRDEYPSDRITVVNNSNDTRAMQELRDGLSADDVRELRLSLGINGDNVGIFVGAMYPEKRLLFLLESCELVRSKVPDFEMLFVGDGVDRHLVDRAAGQNDWVHSVGAQFGRSLACHFAIARVSLLPGAVGLSVLDSFVFEVPLITTSEAHHGPEIHYLRDGINGVKVEGDGSGGRFAEAVVSALTDDALYARLKEGCRESARLYSVQSMVEQFSRGVMEALSTDRG